MTPLVKAAEDASASLTWNAWVSLATAIACFVFVIAYTLLARWWRSYEGKVMTGKAVAIGLLSLYTYLSVEVTPENEAMRWARVGLVAVIALAMVAQTARLITNQLRKGNVE